MNFEGIALTLLLVILTAIVITALCIMAGIIISGHRKQLAIKEANRIKKINLLRQIRGRRLVKSIATDPYIKDIMTVLV
jgi:hypothetical protein